MDYFGITIEYYLNRSRWLKYQFRGLATKRATFAISASKHDGQLVEEVFIYSEESL